MIKLNFEYSNRNKFYFTNLLYMETINRLDVFVREKARSDPAQHPFPVEVLLSHGNRKVTARRYAAIQLKLDLRSAHNRTVAQWVRALI